MKNLQDNFDYYQKQKQEIIKNKETYQSVRYRTDYGPWQQSSHSFSGWEILGGYGTSWWYSVKWGKGRFGYHMKSDDVTKASVRQAIAKKVGRSLDEISDSLVISARGEDPTHWFADKGKMFNTYTIGYSYRKATQREEKFFDQFKYEQALKECEQNIERVSGLIVETQKQEVLQKEIGEKEGQISSAKSDIASLTAKIAEEQLRQKGYESECLKLTKVTEELSVKLGKQQEEIYAQLQEADDQQRSFFLAELWGTSGSEYIISVIKSLGFDANDLAYLAMNKTDNSVFDFALSSGADTASYFIKTKTLLQILVANGKDSLVAKVLEKGGDLTATLANAIALNDLATLDKLLTAKPALLKEKIAGFSLLQIAVAAEEQHIEVIKTLISLDSKLVEILTSNGESVLKMAVRVGNEEVIKLVSKHVNLQIEIDQLGSKIDDATKAEILEKQDIESVIKLFGTEISVSTITEEAEEEMEMSEVLESVTDESMSLDQTTVELVGSDDGSSGSI